MELNFKAIKKDSPVFRRDPPLGWGEQYCTAPQDDPQLPDKRSLTTTEGPNHSAPLTVSTNTLQRRVLQMWYDVEDTASLRAHSCPKCCIYIYSTLELIYSLQEIQVIQEQVRSFYKTSEPYSSKSHYHMKKGRHNCSRLKATKGRQ